MDDTRQQAPAARREDDRLTTGRGEYTDDVAFAGALNAVFVRSPYPSASIRSIDTSAELASEGVVAVLVGADLVAEGFIDCPVPFKLPQGDGTFALQTPRPLLARERVRFVGEPVAMVLARSFAAALDAAERVAVEYEEHACLTRAAEALAPAAPLIWE
ncbi:MAG: xanthine dehydrogenase family protein molybdopterin-binding subunit, partial [Ramlibacter sp.]